MNARSDADYHSTRNSLQVLQTSIILFQQGKDELYRVAALQLRMLLCDSTRRHNQMVDISLLARVLQQPTLPSVFPDAQSARRQGSCRWLPGGNSRWLRLWAIANHPRVYPPGMRPGRWSPRRPQGDGWPGGISTAGKADHPVG